MLEEPSKLGFQGAVMQSLPLKVSEVHLLESQADWVKLMFSVFKTTWKLGLMFSKCTGYFVVAVTVFLQPEGYFRR